MQNFTRTSRKCLVNLSKLPKVAVLDIFIIINSLVFFAYIFLFIAKFTTPKLDTVFLLFETSLMALNCTLVYNYSQFNNKLARIGIIFIFILNIWLSLSAILDLRNFYIGERLSQYFLIEIFITWLFWLFIAILLEKPLRKYMTRIKHDTLFL
jgi:hypothetical protein